MPRQLSCANCCNVISLKFGSKQNEISIKFELWLNNPQWNGSCAEHYSSNGVCINRVVNIVVRELTGSPPPHDPPWVVPFCSGDSQEFISFATFYVMIWYQICSNHIYCISIGILIQENLGVDTKITLFIATRTDVMKHLPKYSVKLDF